MTATLAKLAKCPEICVCTPPAPDGSVNPHILAALSIVGVSEIYKIGGAQAIAAMALGTKTVKPVDKLFGPGNAYVIEAKRQLFGAVGVDLLPGPSEILVLADSSANPRFVASDMLSQAEHGSGREKIFLVTTSKKLVEDVRGLLPEMASKLSRSEALMKIIADGCVVALAPNLGAPAKSRISSRRSTWSSWWLPPKSSPRKYVQPARFSRGIIPLPSSATSPRVRATRCLRGARAGSRADCS